MKIRGNTQIIAGTITNTEINASAAIASSKLADGANWIKKDGSVAMTADLNLGTHKITNVVDPVLAQDVATKTYVDNRAPAAHGSTHYYGGADPIPLADGKIFVGNTFGYMEMRTPSGDVTISNTGVTAIGALKVTNAMLAGSIAASKLVGTDIATVGTITAGTWQGTSIATTYTDAKLKTLTGTANRITIGGTATDPTVDIHTSYVGQNTITTLGTIATGIWNAGAVTSSGDLTINGTGTHTFAGDISIKPTLEGFSALVGGAANSVVVVSGLASDNTQWAIGSDVGFTAPASDRKLFFNAYNGSAWVRAMYMDMSGNATFAGEILAHGDGAISFAKTVGDHKTYIDNPDGGNIATNKIFRLRNSSGVELFSSTYAGNFTFAGSGTFGGTIYGTSNIGQTNNYYLSWGTGIEAHTWAGGWANLSAGAGTFTGDVGIIKATANLYLKDTSTGFQSASTTVVTLQSSNALRSTSFTSGLVGWGINAAGDAEFANITARGAIRTSLFLYNAIQTTGGTLGTFKSAAKLRADVTIPATPTYGTTTVSVDVDDKDGVTHASAATFAVNDIIRLKDGLVGDTWLKVSAVADQTTFWRYTCIIMAGSANVTYNKGLGVPDYGISGDGFIIQTADQTNAPYMQMATHAATFSSSDASGTLVVTPKMRTGNLNGSYGYATDIFGFAVGEYGAASKVSITVDPTNGFRIINNTTQIAGWDNSGNITVGEVGASKSNIYITSGAVQLRNNTTVMVDLSTAGTITVGEVGASKSNIEINAGAMNFRTNTTTYMSLSTAGVITVGEVGASKSNVYISAGAVQLRNNTTVMVDLSTAGVITVGEVGASKSNIEINAGAMNFRTNTTTYMSLSTAGAITVGEVGASKSNVYISAGAVQLRNNTTVMVDLSTAGTITVGEVGASKANIEINAGAMNFRTNTTTYMSLSTAGVITIGEVGASKSNILISAGSLQLRVNTTANITLNTDGTATFTGNITSTATITGGTIQTSSGTGQRVVMDATSGGQVRFYNASNANVVKIGDAAFASIPGILIAEGIVYVTGSTNGVGILSYLTDASGSAISIDAQATGASASNTAVSATATSATQNIGVYAQASGGTTNWAGYFGAGNVMIENKMVNDDVVKCSITVGGTSASRTFTVKVNKMDGADSANNRMMVHWWTSTSSYGTPSITTAGTAAVTTGTNFGTVSTTAVNTAFTDNNETLVITITGGGSATTGTLYFHVEVQGILYTANGVVDNQAIG